MLRFIARYGVVRIVGRRAVPVLLVWDIASFANKTRQFPVVDRALRRGARAARRGLGSAVRGRRRPGGQPPTTAPAEGPDA